MRQLKMFVVGQMEQRSSGGNYPAITQEELGNLKIPIPPKAIQNQIVEKMDKAYQKKQTKEAKAQALLESIDDYLLGELGITLPDQADNSLKSRIFIRGFNEITGGRWDPKFFNNQVLSLKNEITKTIFNKLKLKDLIIDSIAGDWGKDEKENLGDEYKKCLVIRATEFDNQYNLKLDNSRVKYRLIKLDKLNKMNIRLPSKLGNYL